MAEAAESPLVDERFLILESLGSGGMGSVYGAFDRFDRRLVALKVLSERGTAGPAHPLSAEFEAWSRVRHPNIVRVFEMGRARAGPIPKGTPYLVLEHVEGRPVHETLSPGKAAPVVVLEFARQVLCALEHVHFAGLVHRDVKPGNLLVCSSERRTGRIKLTDFGLATNAGSSGEPGHVSGSLPYASPEALLGIPIDGRADLYALGILLHYLSTGKLPFAAQDPAGMVRWHLGHERADPRVVAPKLPDRLSRFMLRLMARDREHRPASATEALDLLGDREVNRAKPPRPFAGRAARASLRLAIDAARLGGRRVLRLPAEGDVAAALVREAHVLGQVHGLFVHPLAAGEASLGRLVLRLLLPCGIEARALIERYRLRRVLPLQLLGDLPVWDHGRERTLAALDPRAACAAACGVAAFFLDAAARQTIVLIVERSALVDPVTHEVVRILTEEATEGGPPAPSRGGFLLLLGRDRRIELRDGSYEHPLVLPQFRQA